MNYDVERNQNLGEMGVERFILHINKPNFSVIHQIQNVMLLEMQNFAFTNGFMQIMPLMLSPITDPLNHSVLPAAIQYYDRKFKLTASMIFHKQMALMTPSVNRLLIVSPNIRLELSDIRSNNHLIEFSQFDLEMKDAAMEDVMDFIESLYIHIFNQLENKCSDELNKLGRKLPKLEKPFPRYNTSERGNMEVDEYCKHLSKSINVPSFVINFKREFYDREDPVQPGTYRNFDLIYPEGYGEGLSGAERESQYEDIIRRMTELDMDLSPFGNYLYLAKRGLLPRTAGCGIGIQRLVKYVTGQKRIGDVCMFDRSVDSEFIF